MSSAGHCGRHDKYRCAKCERDHNDDYHGDDPLPAAKQVSPSVIIEQQAAEIATLRKQVDELELDNQALSDQANAVAREYAEANVERHALREQVARMPGWVSVEDRLPEPDVQVFCYPRSIFQTRHLKPSGEWFFDAIPVTHWMPLPEPPAGEE